jgi:hypothetical protein
MLAHENDACIALGQRAIEMARRVGSVKVLSHALNNVGTGQIGVGNIAGRLLQGRASALALEHDLHEHAACAFTNLSTCAIHARDYEYARRWLDTGI